MFKHRQALGEAHQNDCVTSTDKKEQGSPGFRVLASVMSVINALILGITAIRIELRITYTQKKD
jgi:hypothetical protein